MSNTSVGKTLSMEEAVSLIIHGTSLQVQRSCNRSQRFGLVKTLGVVEELFIGRTCVLHLYS